MDQGRADRALGWYSTLASWAMADDAVRAFNRATEQRAGLKGYAIARAAALGVPVPATRLTNDRAAIAVLGPPEALIAKPAGGGSYCRPVDALVGDDSAWPDGRAPAPAIVQDRLTYPEVRVFLVGGTPFVFETTARTLDFRSDRASVTTHAPPSRVPPALMARLQALARDLRLDFCAFDLKTRAGGSTGPLGDLVFLEVNSGPMFSAFDALAGGALAQAMVRWLVTGRTAEADRTLAAE
jgi:glutathione synthase/RimK-type ligase-like ATP-grasp enzyme